MTDDTIHAIIERAAATAPGSEAILGVGGGPLRYEELRNQIAVIIEALNALGIGRNDRVAVVLPNGPGLAAAFLSIASAATIAPLNPNYTTAEFDFYLKDLGPKALVVEPGSRSPALEAAKERGVRILEWAPVGAPGEFRYDLTGEAREGSAPTGAAHASDAALVLHTSGTTSRPKIVPLTHNNLCASARSIRETLQLAAEDRCLNIMPLFHIHGLMAAVLASMCAGASVACTPGFLAPEFFKWLAAFDPTWYTAVPTMHQVILERAAAQQEVISRSRLRFIRSSSASLAPQVMQALESTFRVPVIEAYGMTEASHQMASNPLPPRARKPGSVGLPAGPDIRIFESESPRAVASGETGEIVIRGPSVTSGYSENPEANAKSFTDGWFRTGDQGYVDEDGYLFIAGRLKEIINRAGEKISPREVDEVFLAHPAVSQAVTFAMPDARLGEAVAVALVLKDSTVTEEQLLEHATSRLALFKVPEKVIILEEIPKGATGKVQRIGLAAKLGLAEPQREAAGPSVRYAEPETQTERKIADIWQEVLGRSRIGIQDAFRKAGGDSMLATVIHARIEQAFDLRVPVASLFRAGNVQKQAELVDALAAKAKQGKPRA